MANWNLALFKKHVKADDFDDDDTYLQHLLKTAGAAVVRATNRDESELIDPDTGALYAEIQQAAMMLGAHWYNQRESVAAAQMHEVPDSIAVLVKPFRKLSK